MIEAILIVSVLMQAPPAQASSPRPARQGWCRGIHMPNGREGVNLLWTTIRGPEEALRTIGDRMKALGADVSETNGQPEIRAHYRDDLDVRAIGRLLNQIDQGEFGPVTTEDYAMSLDTLPVDRCIRFVPRP